MNDEEKIEAAKNATVFVVLGYFIGPDGKERSGLRLPVTPGRTDFKPGSFGSMLSCGDTQALRDALALFALDGNVLRPNKAEDILAEWTRLMRPV